MVAVVPLKVTGTASATAVGTEQLIESAPADDELVQVLFNEWVTLFV